MEPASPDNQYHYNSELKERAQELRLSMTKSEVVLWKHALRGKKMLGFTFNRQRPVIDFIADFMCKELKLIIEVDGMSHQFAEVSEKDVMRQSKLESVGFTVLRFSTQDVLRKTKDVTSIIQRQCEVLSCAKL